MFFTLQGKTADTPGTLFKCNTSRRKRGKSRKTHTIGATKNRPCEGMGWVRGVYWKDSRPCPNQEKGKSIFWVSTEKKNFVVDFFIDLRFFFSDMNTWNIQLHNHEKNNINTNFII
tara:strand:+ start:142 stop:489 length:348 start_codon:yes stop_codon:yes gene_type:complete